MNDFINLDELEKTLIVNWTKFINPNKMISYILSIVRDSKLPEVKKTIDKKNIQITLSQFRPAKNNAYVIWADFIIPKKEGTAIGTCELTLNYITGELKHNTTIGSLYT